EAGSWHSIGYSLHRSLSPAGLAAHHSNEQVGNAGPAHLAQRDQLLPFDRIEQQDAAAENLALVHWLQRPRHDDLLRQHQHLAITRLQFLDTAAEHDTAAVDEHEIGEHVLDLCNLVRRHHDGAVAVEVVI